MVSDVGLYIGDNVAHVYLYSVIDDESARSLTSRVTEANADHSTEAPIVVHINSPGGYVVSALTIVYAIQTSRRPVVTLVEGWAASAAAIIFLAGVRRIIAPHATVLFHEHSQATWGRLGDLGTQLVQATSFGTGMADYVLKRTKIRRDALQRLLRRDKLLDADTCVRWGVAHRLLVGAKLGALPEPARAATFFSHCADGSAEYEEFDRFMADAHRGPRPITVHFGRACENDDTTLADRAIIGQLPWLARIQVSVVPVTGVLDAPVTLVEAIPFIMSDRRIMLSTGSILVQRIESVQAVGAVAADHVENAALVHEFVRGLLRRRARVPASVMAHLEKGPYLITPRNALKWGLADEVVPT